MKIDKDNITQNIKNILHNAIKAYHNIYDDVIIDIDISYHYDNLQGDIIENICSDYYVDNYGDNTSEYEISDIYDNYLI